jgi:UDP-glucose 4-epimerase
MTNVLLAGGAGFLGSNLAEALLAAGHSVRVLDRAGARCLLPEETRRQVAWREGDFHEPASVDAAVAGQEVVFHLVGTTLPKSANENPAFDFASNVVGSICLLEAAARAGVRKVVFMSSGGTVYGPPQAIPIAETHPTEPLTSYGITKLAIEKYLALFHSERGLAYTVLRLSNPFGRYQWPLGTQGVIAVFVWRALTGQPIEIWGNGDVIRDYIYVSDAAAAMLAAMDARADSEVFNVGSGQGRSLNEVVKTIEQVIGAKIAVTYAPSRTLDVPVNVLDTSKIRRVLGWQPQVGFEEGIRRTVEAIREKVPVWLSEFGDQQRAGAAHRAQR